MLKTSDGGKTWRRVYVSKRPFEITWKLAFPSAKVGYVTVQNYNPDASITDRVVAKTVDGGETWRRAALGPEHGKYGFRRWDAQVALAGRGRVALMSRCWNAAGTVQPMTPIWNPGGFLRGNVETTTIVAG